MKIDSNKAKILFLDIETSPNIGFVWGKYEQDVIEYVQEWYLLCASWKWLGDRKIYASAQIDSSGYKKDRTNDKNVLAKLWKVLDEADVVIVHNGAQFDIPKINARFITHGMTPPSPYKVIDTVKVARSKFKFNSNKLNDLSQSLNIGRKVETGGFQLWIDCMAGDKKAWARMVRYNKQDVSLLEEVYLKFRPWITNHPNLNLLSDTVFNCPNCHSDALQSRGFSITTTSKKRRYQCQDCGVWCHGKPESMGVLIRN